MSKHNYINNSLNNCSSIIKTVSNPTNDNDAGTFINNNCDNSTEYGIPTQLGLLMKSVTDFYKNPMYIEQMISIIDQKSILSLRILDWFITNYSKKYKTFLSNSKSKCNLDVYQLYKLQLKSLGKSRLDPFCRKNKLIFYYTDTKFIETSCGQLCFFKWCFENDILNHVKNNLQTIEDDMKKSLKEKKKIIKTNTSGPKREALSINASRSLSKHKVNYTVHFD